MSLGTTVPHVGRSPMKQQASEAFAAFVGLDWADAKHDVCLQAAGTVQREFLRLEHSPEEINAWVQTLRTRFSGQPVAVCLELTKGPIVSALQNYDCLVLFPVNPLTVAKYREAFTPSRAKDDPTDAELQVEILLKHRDKLTPLTKSAEKPRHSCRGGIGVGRAGLNAQEPNKTHAVPEPSMGEGTAEREAPAFMPGRTSQASRKRRSV